MFHLLVPTGPLVDDWAPAGGQMPQPSRGFGILMSQILLLTARHRALDSFPASTAEPSKSKSALGKKTGTRVS